MTKLFCIILSVFSCFSIPALYCQIGQGNQTRDSILSTFEKADAYISLNQYDSAQILLNKIYSLESYRKPSLLNYYLISRQAEIYYYNNLHELGFQEAQKANNVANILNDSLLIADANNFIGLFYMNKGKLSEAKKSLILALQYFPSKPRTKKYLELSLPYHIQGNLAEVYIKLDQIDSAIHYSRLSYEYAKTLNATRGIAIGSLHLGMAYFRANDIDSAYYHYNQAKILATQNKQNDITLNAYAGLADCMSLKSNKDSAFEYLNKGFTLIKETSNINDYFTTVFLESAKNIYYKYDEKNMLVKTLELKTKIQEDTYNKNNTQIQSLLLMGLENEKTIHELELTEAKNKQSLTNKQLYITLLGLLTLIVIFIAYRIQTKNHIRIENVRNKICQDLHDEVGSTLSGISMYSYIIKSQIQNNEQEKVEHSLNIIKDNASEMVGKLNDIVWAVNPIQDNLTSLIDRLKEYAYQITSARNIDLNFVSPKNMKALKIPMNTRKNIYLISKESIHNAVKYSQSKSLQVLISYSNNYFTILVEDDGIGFDIEHIKQGNGLQNIKSRAEEIDAELSITSEISIGTKVKLSVKIT